MACEFAEILPRVIYWARFKKEPVPERVPNPDPNTPCAFPEVLADMQAGAMASSMVCSNCAHRVTGESLSLSLPRIS